MRIVDCLILAAILCSAACGGVSSGGTSSANGAGEKPSTSNVVANAAASAEVKIMHGDRVLASYVAAGPDAAQWLGMAGQVGTLSVGAFADVVLLDADPLTDIGALRGIHGVLRGGQVVRDDRHVFGTARARVICSRLSSWCSTPSAATCRPAPTAAMAPNKGRCT